MVCQERVALLEQYQAKADELLKQQERQVVELKDDLASEKRKQTFIIPIVSALVGFVVGFFVTK